MTFDPGQTTNQILVAAVAALASGPVGWGIVEGLKRLGLQGAAALRSVAWAVCSVIVVLVWGSYSRWDWSVQLLALVAVLGAGGAAEAHAIHRRRKRKPPAGPTP